LTETEAQNKAQNLIDTERNKISASQVAETNRANIEQEKQANLDYKLREKLGLSAQSLDERRVTVGENEFKRDLIKVIADGGLSPDESDALYRKFGYEPPPRTQTPSTPPTTTRVSSPYVGGTDNSL
jgi:hypothetical protein